MLAILIKNRYANERWKMEQERKNQNSVWQWPIRKLELYRVKTERKEFRTVRVRKLMQRARAKNREQKNEKICFSGFSKV